jgi:glyoxylate utilization-related uncharacterized protein
MMKYVKYLTLFTVFLLSSTLLGISGSATSPRYINLQYQPSTHTLKVTVIHFSPAVKIHYVYRIAIEKNGELYQAYLYEKQPGVFLLKYTYNVSVNPGDTLTVSAYCILWGYLSKTKTIATITDSLTIL